MAMSSDLVGTTARPNEHDVVDPSLVRAIQHKYKDQNSNKNKNIDDDRIHKDEVVSENYVIGRVV
jgi:hypothetical protein